MSKGVATAGKMNGPPSLEMEPEPEVEVVQAVQEATVVEVPVEAPGSFLIECPLGALPKGYLPQRVDVRPLTQPQSETLARMLVGLRAKFTKLKNRKEVKDYQDVIRWLLENASDD